MKAYVLVTFSSYLAIAAETSGETCGSEQFQGTEGDSLLQSKQSSVASLAARKNKDAPMEYSILAAGVDDPRLHLLQARQSPRSAVTSKSVIEGPVEPMDVDYDTKGDLIGMSAAKTGQIDSQLQSEESHSFDHKQTSSEPAATIEGPVEPVDVDYDTKGDLTGVSAAKTGQIDSQLQSEQNHSFDQKQTSSEPPATKPKNGIAGPVVAETETPALTAEIVFAVSAMTTMMISTMLLRTESAMASPSKVKSLGRTLLEAESSQ